MANPVGPTPPGGAGSSAKFPQWGIGQINGQWKTIKAGSESEKVADIGKGYDDWFMSASAAQEQIHSQKEPFLNGNIPNPLHGIDEIGAVMEAAYRALTDVKMWRSVGWILLGLGLLFAGLRLWMGKSILPKMPTVVPV